MVHVFGQTLTAYEHGHLHRTGSHISCTDEPHAEGGSRLRQRQNTDRPTGEDRPERRQRNHRAPARASPPWAITAQTQEGTHPQRAQVFAPPAPGRDKPMDVIVVGGGIVGASTAYHLCKKGISTLLVETNHTGQATRAGTGVIHPWPLPWDTPADWAFKLAAAAHLPHLMAELDQDGHPPGYEITGSLSVQTEGSEPAFDLMDSLSRREGFETMGRVHRLGPGRPRELFPLLNQHDRGTLIEGGARLDGAQARHALIEAAQERGLHLRAGQAHLLWEKNRVSGVQVGGEHLRAPVTVVAAGAWSAQLLSPLGADLPLLPVRGQMAHFALPGQDTRAWPGVRFGDHDFHAITFAPNRVATSGTRRLEAGFTHQATAAELSHLLNTALETMPGLGQACLSQTRVGFRPATHDGHQLLGPLRNTPGVVIATGLDSQGLTFGPFQGKVAAHLALGEPTGLDLAPLRPDRPVQAP